MVTYITRTQVLGFPDYTTAAQDGDLLKVYARLRFGRSDLGANKERINGWLAEMEAGAARGLSERVASAGGVSPVRRLLLRSGSGAGLPLKAHFRLCLFLPRQGQAARAARWPRHP